jgi:hypothetical protein
MRDSRGFRALILAAVWTALAPPATAAEAPPEPEQTINEDVTISTQTPLLRLHDPTVQPPSGFDIGYNQGALQIGNTGQGSKIQITAWHVAGGNALVLTGPVGVNQYSPSHPLHVSGYNSTDAQVLIEDFGFTSQARNLLRLRNRGGVTFRFDNRDTDQSWGFGSLSAGSFFIAASGQPGLSLRLSPAGDLQIAGTLTQGSSRAIKDGIEPVQAQDVLARVARLPISTWRYRNAPEARHMGPMAEDFAVAFGLGADDAHVAPADLAAVSLAAVQALQAEVAELRRELDRVRAAAAR